MSAQAVVALRGLGKCLVLFHATAGRCPALRAWRARRTWGVACGLVLGAAETLGLEREAGRVAAKARGEGWHAVVLKGLTALELARLAALVSRRQKPPPRLPTRGAGGGPVQGLSPCLAASTARPPGPGGRWRSPPNLATGTSSAWFTACALPRAG